MKFIRFILVFQLFLDHKEADTLAVPNVLYSSVEAPSKPRKG